jgi:hypothetical protein
LTIHHEVPGIRETYAQKGRREYRRLEPRIVQLGAMRCVPFGVPIRGVADQKGNNGRGERRRHRPRYPHEPISKGKARGMVQDRFASRHKSRVTKNITGPGIGRTAVPEGPAYEDDPSRRHPNADEDRPAEHRQALFGSVGINDRLGVCSNPRRWNACGRRGIRDLLATGCAQCRKRGYDNGNLRSLVGTKCRYVHSMPLSLGQIDPLFATQANGTVGSISNSGCAVPCPRPGRTQSTIERRMDPLGSMLSAPCGARGPI